MSQIDECDFYNKNPYSGCNYGDQPLIQIENQLTADEHKILIISDSFGDCMISCLALVEKNVDSIDLRYFNGSLKAYIEDSQPDIVMIMYNPQAIAGNIDYSTHKDLFDFR
jgi:LmbE family N-acetylglucosaminyl deacetylase